MKSELLVSASPHIRTTDSVTKIMWSVAIALVPVCAAAVHYFGLRALLLIVASTFSCVAVEAIILAFRKENPAYALDGSAAVTGILLALIIPASAPWYIPVVGAVIAIGVLKQLFGGLGHNIWNPALGARVFLQLAYPVSMNLPEWPAPPAQGSVDATTGASPLAKELVAQMLEKMPKYKELLFGMVPGSMGETCKALIILGGLALILLKIVDWRVPLLYVLTVFAMVMILPAPAAAKQNAWLSDPIYHCLSGGLMLGAFFMATDMVTTPLTTAGRVIFAVGCGLLTVLIRFYTAFPEGVAYSILLMNTATPLIDRFVKPRVFGYRKPEKKE